MARNDKVCASLVLRTGSRRLARSDDDRRCIWRSCGCCRAARNSRPRRSSDSEIRRQVRALQSRRTLRLGAEVLEVLKQRHPLLELDPIHGHRRLRQVVDLRAVCADRWLFPRAWRMIFSNKAPVIMVVTSVITRRGIGSVKNPSQVLGKMPEDS